MRILLSTSSPDVTQYTTIGYEKLVKFGKNLANPSHQSQYHHLPLGELSYELYTKIPSSNNNPFTTSVPYDGARPATHVTIAQL